jgi:GNAT superfamily N-acetyltransferase
MASANLRQAASTRCRSPVARKSNSSPRITASTSVAASGPPRTSPSGPSWFLLDPAARGRGLGGALLDTALDYCRDHGAERVFLLTIAGLDAAHHLYRKAGFVLTAEEPVRQWGIEAVEQRFDLHITSR